MTKTILTSLIACSWSPAARVIAPSTKLQAPNPKQALSTKFKTQDPRHAIRRFEFRICNFEFVCDLGLRIWCLASHACDSVLAIRSFPLRWALLSLLALSGCGSASKSPQPPVDLRLSSAADLARSEYDHLQTRSAAVLYERVLALARMQDDADQIVNAAYNLAVCHVHLRNYAQAEQLLREAQVELNDTGDNAEILLLSARVAMLQNRRCDAKFLARHIANDPHRAPLHRLRAHLLLGHLACDPPDLAAAQDHLNNAKSCISSRTTTAPIAPATAAALKHLEGRIHLLANRTNDAVQCFQREVTLLAQARAHRELPHARARLAQALRQANRHQESAYQFYRAARSLLAQEDPQRAGEWLQQAQLQATQADAILLLSQIRSLQAATLPTTRPVQAEVKP